MKNAVIDLQAADFDTFDRPLKRLASTFKSNGLKDVADGLRDGVDLDTFLGGASEDGSVMGSAKLDWPTDREQELGIAIALIERGAEDPSWFISFAIQHYRSGRKYIESIRKVVASVIIPFSRDFASHVENSGKFDLKQGQSSPNFDRVFVVHGHNEALKEAIARFVMQMGLEPVILHEQASVGMTVLEKLDANANVGYAVVILTADDLGRAKYSEKDSRRARQNVIFELGFFLGRLGRERVMAILEDGVEIPSDYMGVVYTPLDDLGAWRQTLVREMQAVGYVVDWNKAMS